MTKEKEENSSQVEPEFFMLINVSTYTRVRMRAKTLHNFLNVISFNNTRLIGNVSMLHEKGHIFIVAPSNRCRTTSVINRRNNTTHTQTNKQTDNNFSSDFRRIKTQRLIRV